MFPDGNVEVNWRQDLGGDHIVNPAGRVLTLTVPQAHRFRIARGIAGDRKELATALGYGDNIEWINIPPPNSQCE